MLSVTNSDSSHDIRQGRRLEMRIGSIFGQGLKKLKNYNSNGTRMFRSKREDEEQTNSVCSTSIESTNVQMVALSTAIALGLSI